MEIKLFNHKALSLSEAANQMEKLYSSSVSSYRNHLGVTFSGSFSSCKGKTFVHYFSLFVLMLVWQKIKWSVYSFLCYAIVCVQGFLRKPLIRGFQAVVIGQNKQLVRMEVKVLEQKVTSIGLMERTGRHRICGLERSEYSMPSTMSMAGLLSIPIDCPPTPTLSLIFFGARFRAGKCR